MLVFGAVGSYHFYKHLINSLIFQTSLYNLGRCEMILAMPPPIYIVSNMTILAQNIFKIYSIVKASHMHQ